VGGQIGARHTKGQSAAEPPEEASQTPGERVLSTKARRGARRCPAKRHV